MSHRGGVMRDTGGWGSNERHMRGGGGGGNERHRGEWEEDRGGVMTDTDGGGGE